MPHARIVFASSGTLSSCLISNRCSVTIWETVNIGSSLTFSLDRALPHPSCRGSMLSDSDVVLDQCGYHTNPIRSCVHTPPVPSRIRRPGEALPKGQLSTSPRAAVDIESAAFVDEEVAIGRTYSCAHAGSAARACTWAVLVVQKRCDLVCHRLVLGVFLGHQNHSLNFHLLYGSYSSALQGL